MSTFQFWALIAVIFMNTWAIEHRLQKIEAWLSFLARRGSAAE